jgi:class 3 adenylate cyclase
MMQTTPLQQFLDAPTPASTDVHATLEVFGTSGHRETISVSHLPMTIGRAPSCDVVLRSPSVSKLHAELFWRGDDLFFQDSTSCNGSRRDGRPLTEATRLHDADELVLGGNVMLRVRIENARFGALAEDSPMHQVGLVATDVPIHEPVQLDLLPIVTKLYQAGSYEELALQLTRATADALGASRLALLEVEDGGERFRTLGLFSNVRYDSRPLRDASFVSRTVLRETLTRGVVHFEASRQPLSESIIASGAHSAAAAVIRPHDGRLRVIYADAVMGEPPLGPEHVSALGLIAAHAAGAFDALDARLRNAHERVRFDQLRRYFSPAVVEHLLAGNADLVDRPHHRYATVLFADLVGYTKLSERLRHDPERLLGLLNSWLDIGAETVLEHGGTLDKFIGDCVMAVFGAPFEQPQAEVMAVRAALAMQERITKIAEELREPLCITVGINSGWMLAGSVGSKRRLEYTVLGDTVNVASRLQGQAAAGEILVGEALLPHLKGIAQLTDAGVRELKNHGPVRAFRVDGLTERPSAVDEPSSTPTLVPKAMGHDR